MIIRKPPAKRSHRRRRIGPRDEGRLLSAEEYCTCIEASGYVSEIIDGAIRVSRSARPIHDFWRVIIQSRIWQFAENRPAQINYVTTNSDVVVGGRPGETRLQPDIAAFRDFPRDLEILSEKNDWAFFSPILVAELVSSRRSRKDTYRNRNLYWLVSSIREYWIVDLRVSHIEPRFTVCTREAGVDDWVENEIPFGEVWRSRLISGLEISLANLGK